MAGTKINNYSEGDKNLTSLMYSTDNQRRGYHAASLTNWVNTTIPQIAAGSSLEVGGALIEFQADEAISGTPSDSQNNYIIIDSSAFTATWSTVAPVWNDEKQGYYSGTNRYLNYMVYRSGSNYTKYEIQGSSLLFSKYNGDVVCGSITSGAISSGAITSSGNINNGSNSLTTGAINTQNNNISMGTGDLTCDSITSGAINTQNNNISMGTGDLTCDSISSGAINTNNNSINVGTGNIDSDGVINCDGYFEGLYRVNTNLSLDNTYTRGDVYSALSSDLPDNNFRYLCSGIQDFLGTQTIVRSIRRSGTSIYILSSSTTPQVYTSGDATSLGANGVYISL